MRILSAAMRASSPRASNRSTRSNGIHSPASMSKPAVTIRPCSSMIKWSGIGFPVLYRASPSMRRTPISVRTRRTIAPSLRQTERSIRLIFCALDVASEQSGTAGVAARRIALIAAAHRAAHRCPGGAPQNSGAMRPIHEAWSLRTRERGRTGRAADDTGIADVRQNQAEAGSRVNTFIAIVRLATRIGSGSPVSQDVRANPAIRPQRIDPARKFLIR